MAATQQWSQLQGHEIPEEKFLPKGVSLGALQLNRHYTETRTLPSVLQEVSASVKKSNSSRKMTAGHMTKSMVTSVQVPRVLQNSTSNRKAGGRTHRNTSRISRTLSSPKTMVPAARANTTRTAASVPTADFNMKEIKKDKDEENKLQEQRKHDVDSLLELLRVAQTFPRGSIEELIRSLKGFITIISKANIAEGSGNLTQENRNDTVSLSNLLQGLQGKVQKCSPQASLLVPQTVSTTKIIPTVTTNLGLWPLTLFPSVTTSQSVASGPRVARVAPIAPTTVVSSPGLARAVRVCVAEAPNISMEPPKKKPCDHLPSMDYELVERSQLVSEPVVNVSAPIVSQSPEVTFNTVRQPTTQEVINNYCDRQTNVTTASTMDTQEHRVIHTTSQGISETSPVLSSGVGNTLNAPQQQQQPPPPFYQNITPSLLQTISQASQQVSQSLNVNVTMNQGPEVNQALSVPLRQPIQQVSQPMNVPVNHTTQDVSQSMTVTLNQNLQERNQPLNVSCLPSTPEVNQIVRQPESQTISQHPNPQELNVSPVVPSSTSGSLFTQSTNMGTSQLGVAAQAAISSSTSNQATTLTPPSGVSSALTHSDPLLSQSVAPMQLDQSVAAPQSRNQAAEPRPRGEVLMTPSSTASQVSLQNEVTSAINLSETEFLNYFDPNCFDNV